MLRLSSYGSALHCHYLDCLQGAGTDTITAALAEGGMWHRYLERCLLLDQLMGAGQRCNTDSTVASLGITPIEVYQSHLTWHQPFPLASFAFSLHPPVAGRLPKFRAKLGMVCMIRRKERSRILLFENLRVAIEKHIIFFPSSNGYPDETR